MRIVAAVMLLFSFAPILQACSTPKKADTNLELKQVGEDVIVSTTLDSGGIGHMVLTSYVIDAKNHVTLKYCIIQSEQNSRLDIFARIRVEWRLANVRLQDLSFEIAGSQMIVPTEQLRRLRNQLDHVLHEKDSPCRDAALKGSAQHATE
jgi:hypothetical protein